ncbi:MAG: hypothetical protein DMG44_14470 [Acidobacteria bacterium]|nr:MAG: hypothetical protein DMG44_14470 [Acidobacteriota bacterium]
MERKSQGPSASLAPNATSPINVPTLLTTEQAARVLGVKPQTLSIWRCKKRYGLRYRKVGGSVRYVMTDLLKFLEEAAVTPAAIRKPAIHRRSSPRRSARSARSF